MRLHILTTRNTELVSFAYQQKLAGVLHKWLDKSDLDVLMASYSFSWLLNGKISGKSLEFKNGAKWFISIYNDSNVDAIIRRIRESPSMFCGMKVEDIVVQKTPDLSDVELFQVASPVFIKRKVESNNQYFFYTDKDAGRFLVETLNKKMLNMNLPLDETLAISFDQNDSLKKIKFVNYRGVGIKASLCSLIIQGKPETKAFAWDVGIGNSTGIGFGAIY